MLYVAQVICLNWTRNVHTCFPRGSLWAVVYRRRTRLHYVRKRRRSKWAQWVFWGVSRDSKMQFSPRCPYIQAGQLASGSALRFLQFALSIKRPKNERGSNREMKWNEISEKVSSAATKRTQIGQIGNELRIRVGAVELTLPLESSWYWTPLCKKGLALPRRKRLMGLNAIFLVLPIRLFFACKIPSPPEGFPMSSVTLQVLFQVFNVKWK